MPLDIVSLSALKAEDRTVIEPWRRLEKRGLIRVRYREFALLRQLQWILRGREKSPLSRVVRNLAGIAGLLATRGRIVILGTEPHRAFSLFVNRLKARHTCIWHGSWPWEEEAFDYGVRSRWLRATWSRFLRGTVCVCASAASRDALVSYGARPFWIPWPVDTGTFVPGGAPRRDGGLRVLFVGELSRHKGVHLLIDLIKGTPWVDTRFVFAGRGPYQGAIEGMVREGLPVEYLGFVANTADLVRAMQGCDMLVLPSVRIGGIEEKFGMVLTEAMACGLPVIGSDCIGPRQVISHGDDGLLIPQNDVPALKSAILELAGDPDRRRAMGARGREKAVSTYDVGVLAAKWMAAIEAAAGTRETETGGPGPDAAG